MNPATKPDIAMTADEELHWLALILVPGLGPRTSVQLIQRFRSPEAIFRASPTELEACGVSGSLARSLASGCSFDDAAGQKDKMLATGTVLITIADSRYPQHLREIYDPPVLLFARGRTELLDSVIFSIVGTRRPTQYGLTVAEKMGMELAAAGVSIGSGMARGIDTAAHKGALAAGGNTIAVFGCGVDLVYPTENRKLAAEIAAKGLLLSEFPLSTPAYPQNFPIRNRIVSGISSGILVVEGAEFSGSAITARLAMEQNREVFAVPGNITSKMSWGPNLLIKDGAQVAMSPQNILDGLPVGDRIRLAAQRNLLLPGLHPIKGADGDAAVTAALGPNERPARAILDALSVDTPLNLDELLSRVDNYSSTEVIGILFELELLGVVRQLPGKNFVKVWLE
ncbi:MAG: DNA-processing protein DprA [Bryobacteraceae bacterium]